MSSILKALQKLETASTQQAKGRRLTGGPITRATLQWRVVSIFIALFFIIATGGFFLINRNLIDLKPISDIAKGKQEIRVPGSDARSNQGGNKTLPPPVQKQTHTAKDDLKPKKTGQIDPLNQTVQTTGVQIARPSSSTTSDNNTRHIMPAHTNPITQNKEKSVPRTSRALPPRQVNKISTIPDIPIIDPSILKLQAISWSPTPKDRMVVINNRILREKSAIEGYAIILIDEDTVIVEKDAEKGKLVFK